MSLTISTTQVTLVSCEKGSGLPGVGGGKKRRPCIVHCKLFDFEPSKGIAGLKVSTQIMKEDEHERQTSAHYAREPNVVTSGLAR